jgi:periplasmic copper chaperone A
MSIRRSLLSLCAAIAAVAAGLMGNPAKSSSEPVIKVESAWVRETPLGGTSGGGYMRIENTGNESDRLLSAESSAAESIVLQEITYVDDKLRTRSLTKGIEIPPNKVITLQWNSSHLLFAGLKAPFAPHTRIEATLNFEKAGRIPVEFYVRPRVEQ